MAEAPTGRALREAKLQSELSRVTVLLGLAAAEKGSQSCSSSLASCGSCAGVLIGLGLVTCGSPVAPIGLVIALLSAGGFVMSLRGYGAQVPSQEKAERAIEQLGEKLEGTETLHIDKQDLRLLHRLLGTASQSVTIGILRILAVVGDADSLSMARWMAGQPQEQYLSRVGDSPEVKREAARAAELLEQRLSTARQRETLLRPSETGRDADLLRPVTDQSADPDRLLRPDDRESLL